jgi:hypothetical protein
LILSLVTYVMILVPAAAAMSSGSCVGLPDMYDGMTHLRMIVDAIVYLLPFYFTRLLTTSSRPWTAFLLNAAYLVLAFGNHMIHWRGRWGMSYQLDVYNLIVIWCVALIFTLFVYHHDVLWKRKKSKTR